jgi:phasin family protein
MTNETTTINAAEPASATANLAADCLKQTIADLSAGMARASAGFEETQTKLIQSTETTMAKVAEVVGGNIEALARSGQIWATGMQDLSKQVAGSFQASFQDTAGVIKTLATVKSLKEAIELQSGLVRATLDKAVSESSRLAHASLKLTEQTLAPVTERVRIAGAAFSKVA